MNNNCFNKSNLIYFFDKKIKTDENRSFWTYVA